MIDIILDTNNIIYYSKGLPQGKIIADLMKTDLRFGISTVTEAELLAKPGLIEEEQIIIEESLKMFESIPVSSEIAKWAGYYLSQYNISLGDALIAATARSYDLPLWTYNVKDFQKMSGLRVAEPGK